MMADIYNFKAESYPLNTNVIGWSNATQVDRMFGILNTSPTSTILLTVKAIYTEWDGSSENMTLTIAARGPTADLTNIPASDALLSLAVKDSDVFILSEAAQSAAYTVGALLGSSDPADNCAQWTWTIPITDTENPFTEFVVYDGTLGLGAAFNCACDETTDNETLAQLRRRMLVRLGYAAQADSPPPGMADLLSDFLVQAQRLLYRRFKALRTTRMFTWTMVPGQRFYDLPDNDETCTKRLDPYEIEWCGFSDLNGIWLQLIEGIPPEFYTAVRFLGYPSRYEVKQCIEIFPAPSAAYKLRIKGKFGLTAFAADADPTTINSELVFLWALGNAKAHYGQPDADRIIAQANQYLHDLTAGAHLTARYVPGTSPSQPWTQPKFLPISGS